MLVSLSERGRMSRVRRKHEKGICDLCGNPVAKGRRNWCSDRCAMIFSIGKGHYGHWRKELFQEFGGKCDQCGVDFRCLMLELHRAFRGWEIGELHREKAPIFWGFPYKGDFGPRTCRWLGYNLGQRLYQIDHIVPLADGGWNVIENLRLLCVPCHKSVTKAWRKSKKKERVLPVKNHLTSENGQAKMGDHLGGQHGADGRGSPI